MTLKRIQAPRLQTDSPIVVDAVHVREGQRVYRDEILLHLLVDDDLTPMPAPLQGWVRRVVVKVDQHVKRGELLILLDVLDESEFVPDGEEVNPHTELGGEGRRGIERELQSKHANGYANPLFDAPSEKQGQGMGPNLPEHPYLKRAKESVPPKMQDVVSQNDTAVEKAQEDASKDPELQKQLSAKLANNLQVSATPTPSTPTPSPLG